MIKFFRRTRQQLLSENPSGQSNQEGKFSKYLLYAIGEIILVVVGILIALQINNWNEEQKNEKLKQAYLKDVNKEFEANKMQFEVTLNKYIEQFEIADSLAENEFPITDDNWPQIIKIYASPFLPQSFDPSNSSIEVLINSGKIDLVKNDSLKKLLLSWNDQYGDYKEGENALQKWWDVYNEIYLNEPNYSVFEAGKIRSNHTPKISNNLKLKLEKLMWMRRADLGLVTSKWKVNQESKELMNSIDSIISLTDKYDN